MQTHHVRGLAVALAVSLAGCSGGATPATPSGTQDAVVRHAGQSFEVFRKATFVPDPGAPAILMNFLANGPAQGGVPCFDCVNGASSSDNIGLTGPQNYIPSGATWQYVISFTNNSYKGKCKLDWTIVAGKRTVDSFSASFDLTSSGGFIIYGVNRARPKYSGAATLTGKVTCGKNTPSLQVPLYFQ